MSLGGLGIALGFFYRLSALLNAVTWTWVFFSDTLLYQNHYYMFVLVSWIMVCIPAHGAFSLDARQGRVKSSQQIHRWALLVLQFQLFVVYFYGGLAKINADWLAGEPMRTWMNSPGRDPLLRSEWMIMGMAWSGILLDLLIVPALLWRPTRYLALAAISSFHLFNHFLWEIGIFPWFMLLATLIFLPAKVFRLGVRSRTRRRKAALRQQADGLMSPKAEKPLLFVLMVFVVFQLLFPFRHYLYEGDVKWTEEGSRFAWQMKLRNKSHIGNLPSPRAFSTQPQFRVEDASGKTLATLAPNAVAGLLADASDKSPLGYQTAHWRFRYTCILPRELQKLCKALKQSLAEAPTPIPDARIYVENLYVSMNGRKPQLLVDPKVDLAGQPETLGHASWIMPLTEPLRLPAENSEEK